MARSLHLLAVAAAAAVVAAQTTTVSLLILGADPQPLVGSVVNVDKALTTYVLDCPHGEDPNDCGFPNGITLTQGPSTWHAVVSDGPSFNEVLDCKLDSKHDLASCSVSASNHAGGSALESSSVYTTSGYLTYMFPVTITAGAGKLSAAPGATGSAAVTASAPTASSTGAASTAASASGSKPSSSGSAKSTSTNAAGPAVTQNAIMAGVAAIVGGAMML